MTFVSHVQPDPDSLGSMLGLAHLVENCLGLPTRLTRDGEICRAENRAMVDILDIDLVPIEDIVWHDADAVVMVDSQPRTGRHSFLAITSRSTPSSTTTRRRAISKTSPFLDIRRRMSGRPVRS